MLHVQSDIKSIKSTWKLTNIVYDNRCDFYALVKILFLGFSSCLSFSWCSTEVNEVFNTYDTIFRLLVELKHGVSGMVKMGNKFDLSSMYSSNWNQLIACVSSILLNFCIRKIVPVPVNCTILVNHLYLYKLNKCCCKKNLSGFLQSFCLSYK